MFKVWILIMIATGTGDSIPREVTVVENIATQEDCHRLGKRFLETARRTHWADDQEYSCTEIRKVR